VQAASSILALFADIHKEEACLFIEVLEKTKKLATRKLALTNLFHLSNMRFVLGVR